MMRKCCGTDYSYVNYMLAYRHRRSSSASHRPHICLHRPGKQIIEICLIVATSTRWEGTLKRFRRLTLNVINRSLLVFSDEIQASVIEIFVF